MIQLIKRGRYDYGPMLLRGYHSELIKGLGTDHTDYSMDQLYQEFDSSVPAAIALGLNTVSVSKNNFRLKLLKYVNLIIHLFIIIILGDEGEGRGYEPKFGESPIDQKIASSGSSQGGNKQKTDLI